MYCDRQMVIPCEQYVVTTHKTSSKGKEPPHLSMEIKFKRPDDRDVHATFEISNDSELNGIYVMSSEGKTIDTIGFEEIY
jgi:hypothetical protein